MEWGVFFVVVAREDGKGSGKSVRGCCGSSASAGASYWSRFIMGASCLLAG